MRQLDSRRRPARRGRPAVLFVEEEGWGAFYQLASILRRRGFRAVRITSAPLGRAVERAPVVYNRTVHIASHDDLDRLDELLGGEQVVDVQCTEKFAGAVYRHAPGAFAAREALRLERRAAACDKLSVAGTLEAAGVAVPAALPCTETSAADAVGSLGLPMLVKPILGWGGRGVRVLRTEREVAEVLASEPVARRSFLERFVHGEYCQLSVLAASGTVVRGAACSVLERRYEHGPASRIVTVLDERLKDVARRTVAALGLGGLANIGVVCDGTGSVFVHDVNPRAWGSFSAYGNAGVDFGESYVELLQGRCDLAPRWAHPGVTAVVPPADLDEAIASPRRSPLAWSATPVLFSYVGRYGWRYAALVAATSARAARSGAPRDRS